MIHESNLYCNKETFLAGTEKQHENFRKKTMLLIDKFLLDVDRAATEIYLIPGEISEAYTITFNVQIGKKVKDKT